MCEVCQNTLTINAQYDPTRTTTLRNLFVRAMNKRFDALTKQIYTKIVTEDCFGLDRLIQWNAVREQFLFPRSAQKVEAFMTWLRQQVAEGILSVREYEQIGQSIDKAWTGLYITDSYKRGVIRARYELQKAGYIVPSIAATGGIEMSMMIPLHMDRLGLLYTRTYSELKGITSAMDTQISRILAQGIADGDGPRLLARKMISTINGSGMGDLAMTDKLGRFIPAKRRAETLARTEIIRAHHQAMIQEYKGWAVEGVFVQAEFLTAGDDRVCSICEGLEAGNPYTLDVAMNLIPVHPNCRCICLPYEVGVDTLIKR